MRKIMAILFMATFCFALNHTSTTYVPTNGGIISSSGNKANFDSLRNGINQTKDTVNRDHDSLNTRSVRAAKGQFDTLLGKPTYLKGRLVGDTIAGTFSSATNGNFTNLTYDSLGGRVIAASGGITGNVTGNVTGSSGSCTGNAATATTASACSGNAATATTCTGNAATATTASGLNGPAVADSLRFGSSTSYLKSYIDTTYIDTFKTGLTVIGTRTARIIQCGKVVTLCEDSITGTIGGGVSDCYRVPAKFTPAIDSYWGIYIRNNGTSGNGLVRVLANDPRIYIRQAMNSTLDAGTGGTFGFTISWIIN